MALLIIWWFGGLKGCARLSADGPDYCIPQPD
jgi:hypothetical protein